MKKLFYGLMSISVAGLFCASALAQPLTSIRQWVKGDGVTDDHDGVTNALFAARNGAFTLLVDCPVFIHVGTNWNAQIYIRSGTSVTFNHGGKFIVDNDGCPTFVMINQTNIGFTNINMLYSGGLDVSGTGGSGHTIPIQIYNVWASFEYWMSKNLGISWGPNTVWNGMSGCATFYIMGGCSNITFNGGNFYVATNANASQFIPWLFAFEIGPKNGSSIVSTTAMTSAIWDIPQNLLFTNITIDGCYMGFQGILKNATFSHIRSFRYSDLQDANGNYAGGTNDWFPPPHLFYLNWDTTYDPALWNTNIQINDVIDYGQRIGSGVRDTGSGNCCSLKFGSMNGLVDKYTSSRPDGFFDVLQANGMVCQNLTATYNSTLLSNKWTAVRWPSGDTNVAYKNITFNYVSVTDLATNTGMHPFYGENVSVSTNIVVTNTTVHINNWTGTTSPGYNPASPPPYPYTFPGASNNIRIYAICKSGWTTDGDTNFPTAPSNLVATVVGASQVNLTWSTASDNIGVTGYKIYRNGIQVDTAAANAFSDTGLAASTLYNYTVSAYDAAGNESTPSQSASVTTLPALTLQNFGSYLQVNWPAEPGTVLLQTTNVAGPWTTNSSTSSPLTATPLGSQMFFQSR